MFLVAGFTEVETIPELRDKSAPHFQRQTWRSAVKPANVSAL